MKKYAVSAIVLLIIVIGIFFAKDFLPQFGNTDGELRIDSAPKTTVFIDGENKGETPFVTEVPAGAYDIKLIPEQESSTSSWQQQVTINERVQTYINASLKATDLTSSWEIVTLEKGTRGSTEISIFSHTEQADIFIDGDRQGTTPQSFKEISAGTHDIRFISADHEEKNMKVTLTPGYKLNVLIQLARINEASPSASENEETENNELSSNETSVTILDTPTGWLRVREEPSTAGEEVGRVDPGSSYPLLEEENGWYQIEYTKGEKGWISGTYAKEDQ